MSDEAMLRAARVQATAAAALIRAMGMQAANQARLANDLALAYDEAAFERLAQEYGLDWNTLIEATRP